MEMDRLEQIFKRQLELTTEFHRIEVHNGLCDYKDIPFKLSDCLAQKQLRTTAWYIVEEMGEVLKAKTSEDRQKEIVDVFHFLVELLICSGIEAWQIYPIVEADKLDKLFIEALHMDTDEATLDFVEELAWAIHHLKAKPWKQNPRPTSEIMYKHKLLGAFFAFIHYAKSYGLTPDLLFNSYMGKAKINKERIDSGV